VSFVVGFVAPTVALASRRHYRWQ